MIHPRPLLETDVMTARPMSYVLARGPGGVPYPDRDDAWGLAAHVPADVASEVLDEHGRHLGIDRWDDKHPEYWPAFCRTNVGISIAFLGGAKMNHSNAVNWVDQPVVCCSHLEVELVQPYTLLVPASRRTDSQRPRAPKIHHKPLAHGSM